MRSGGKGVRSGAEGRGGSEECMERERVEWGTELESRVGSESSLE